MQPCNYLNFIMENVNKQFYEFRIVDPELNANMFAHYLEALKLMSVR